MRNGKECIVANSKTVEPNTFCRLFHDQCLQICYRVLPLEVLPLIYLNTVFDWLLWFFESSSTEGWKESYLPHPLPLPFTLALWLIFLIWSLSVKLVAYLKSSCNKQNLYLFSVCLFTLVFQSFSKLPPAPYGGEDWRIGYSNKQTKKFWADTSEQQAVFFQQSDWLGVRI